jgi:hypothetical protein
VEINGRVDPGSGWGQTPAVVEEKPPVYAIVDREHNEDVIVVLVDTKPEAEAMARALRRRGRRVHVEPAAEFTST